MHCFESAACLGLNWNQAGCTPDLNQDCHPTLLQLGVAVDVGCTHEHPQKLIGSAGSVLLPHACSWPHACLFWSKPTAVAQQHLPDSQPLPPSQAPASLPQHHMQHANCPTLVYVRAPGHTKMQAQVAGDGVFLLVEQGSPQQPPTLPGARCRPGAGPAVSLASAGTIPDRAMCRKLQTCGC